MPEGIPSDGEKPFSAMRPDEALARLARAAGRLLVGVSQGPDHPDVGRSLNNLAVLRFAEANTDSAEALLRRAFGILEAAWRRDAMLRGVGHSLAVVSTNRGFINRARRDESTAESSFNLALAILDRDGSADPALAFALVGLAASHRARGLDDRAEPLMIRALQIRESALGVEHLDVARSLVDLAEVLRSQGRAASAEASLRRAENILEGTVGHNHPRMATCLHRMAALQHQLGHHAEAEVLFDRALAIKVETLGLDHPSVARTLERYAALLADLGHHRQAADMLLRIPGGAAPADGVPVDLLDLQLLPPEAHYPHYHVSCPRPPATGEAAHRE